MAKGTSLYQAFLGDFREQALALLAAVERHIGEHEEKVEVTWLDPTDWSAATTEAALAVDGPNEFSIAIGLRVTRVREQIVVPLRVSVAAGSGSNASISVSVGGKPAIIGNAPNEVGHAIVLCASALAHEYVGKRATLSANVPDDHPVAPPKRRRT